MWREDGERGICKFEVLHCSGASVFWRAGIEERDITYFFDWRTLGPRHVVKAKLVALGYDDDGAE